MRTLLILIVVAFAALGGYFLREYRDAVDVDARALEIQDQVRRIARFATAEGTYVRMVRYDDPGYTTWFNVNDKHVLVQARARVLMGFDLEGVTVTVDEAAHELVVRGWPPPEELAFELDTDYFDVRKGVLVELDAAELNKIGGKVRKLMREQVDAPALRAESYAQAEELLGIVRAGLAGSGWSLRVEDWPATARPADAG